MKPVNETHAAMVTYFAAEKRESLLFLIVGLAAIAVSAALWRGASPWRGMAWPLVAVALIQLIAGGTVYFRTDAQALRLHKLLAADPAGYMAAELPRMETVRRSFRLYKGIEIALLAAGLAGFLLLRGRQTLFAASCGLLLQSALMLAADLVAESRAETYLEQIRRLG